MTTSMTAVPINTQGRFAHVDALRAVAVLLVVLAHSGLGDIVPGGSGVTIFFSISGFVITSVLLGERARQGGFVISGFYRRRFLKLAPPLLLVVLLPTAIYAYFEPVDVGAVLSQVFFGFNWYALAYGTEHILPGSVVVWSLAIEEQFYILFAVIWLVVVRSGHWMMWLASASIAVIACATIERLVIAGGAEAESRIYYGSDTRMDAIAWGILAAVAVHLASRGDVLARSALALFGRDGVLVVSALLYLASLGYREEIFRETWRFSMQSVAATSVILYGFAARDTALARAFVAATTWRPVQVIGLASYSIYLVHLPVARLLGPVTSSLPLLGTAALLAVVGVVCGIAIYQLVEVPVQRWAGRGRSGSR